MTDYREYLDRKGVARGPWVIRERESKKTETPPAKEGVGNG